MDFRSAACSLTVFTAAAAGGIRHTLRFTAPPMRKEYPSMGQRFRRRADFNLSGYRRETPINLRALFRQ